MYYSSVRFLRAHYQTFMILAVCMLLVSSNAIADIISGAFSTNQSHDVTITQISIAEPASVSVGDLLLASIAINGGNAALITPPAGWTQILRTDNDTNVSIVSYWKIAGESEPSTYTWSIDHQTTAEGGITKYSGVDTIHPIDASAGNAGFSTTATTTSVATSAADEEVMTLFAADVGKSVNAGTYFSTPTGMTEKYDVSNTPFGPSTATDDAIQVAAGASGSFASTISGNKARNWVSQQIALRHPPSGIVFDSSSQAGYEEGNTSITWPHTVSGTNTLLIVCGATYDTDFTGATYDGVTMTPLADVGATAYDALGGPGHYVACFGLLSPHTGTHSIVLSRSGTYLWIEGEAESFSSVSQASLPTTVFADHKIATGIYTGSLTTTADSLWGLLFTLKYDISGSSPTAGSGTVIRESIPGYGINIGDSNGPWSPPGSHSLSMSVPNAATNWDAILISFAPAN